MFEQLVPIATWVVAGGLVYALYRRSRLVRSPAPTEKTGAESAAQAVDGVDYYWRPG